MGIKQSSAGEVCISKSKPCRVSMTLQGSFTYFSLIYYLHWIQLSCCILLSIS